jgi:hypothetical protein
MEGDKPVKKNRADYNTAGVKGAAGAIQVAGNTTLKEKIITGAVVVMVFVAAFFAYYQLASGFKAPMAWMLKSGGSELAQNAANSADGYLKLIDTDGDGLSDYDELYIYKTSPYLEDSDSDGSSDKQEITAGYDPNCPGQEACFSGSFNVAYSNTSSVPIFGALPGLNQQMITPALLREAFRKSGMSEEEISQLSDEELMQMFQRALAENPEILQQLQAGLGSNGNNQANIQTTNETVGQTIDLGQLGIKSTEDLKNLTGAQIRQLMIQQGATAELLAPVSDEQLKAIFLSKIEEQISGN